MDEAGVNAVIQNLGQFKADAAEMDRAVGSACDSMEKSVGGVDKTLEALGTKMTSVGKQLSVAVTAPLVGLGTLAVKMAGDFEAEMANVSLSAEGAGGSIEEMRQYALEMGRTTPFAANEVAKAMDLLLREGRNWTEVQEIMAGATNLAAKEDMSLAEAAGITEDALDTFNYDASRTTEIVDALGKFTLISSGSLEDFKESLSTVGPTAQQLGFNLDDVSVALAILANRDIKGSEAGMALNTMFNNLLRPTDDVKGALDTLGISVYDSEGNMKDLSVIMKDLGTALGENATMAVASGGATKELAAKYADAVGNIDEARGKMISLEAQWGPKGMTYAFLKDMQAQGRLAENLVTAESRAIWDAGQKLEGYEGTIRDYQAAQAGATTSTVTMTDEMRNNLLETLAGVRGKKALNLILAEGSQGWDDMAKRVGEAATAEEAARKKSETFQGQVKLLKASLQTFLEDVGMPLISEFLMPLIEKVRLVVAWFSNLDDRSKGLILVFAGVAAAIGPVLMVLGTLITSVGTVIGAASALGGVIAGIASAIGAPILVPLAAIAAAIAVLYLAWTENWGGIRDTVQEAVDNLREIFDDVVLYLQEYIPQALAVLKAGWDVIWPAIQSLLETVWGVIGPFIQSAVENITNIIGSAWALIRDWTAENWPLIQNTIATVMAAISVIIQTISDAIKWVWDRWGKDILGIVQTAWDMIRTAIETVLNVILGIIKVAMQLITGDWSGAWETVKTIAQTVWDGIVKIVDLAIGKIKELLPRVIQAGKDLIQGLLNGMIAVKDKILDFIWGLVRSVWDAIKNFFGIGSPSTLMETAGRNLIAGLIAGMEEMRPVLEAQARMTLAPIMQVAAPAMVAAPVVVQGGSTFNYNLSANYAQTQSAASIRDDLMAMEMLAGSRR